MTLLERLKIRIPEESNDAVLRELLETSKDVILTHLYPLEDDLQGKAMPLKYRTLQLQIAVELYNKQGAEGETSHSENGISRQYDSAYISKDLLSQITPYAQVIGLTGDEQCET